MGFTPICPKCGSAYCSPSSKPGSKRLICNRCCHAAPRNVFVSIDNRLDDTPVDARKRGAPLPTRTIPLSDE